jgi:hypothetical protein
MNIREGDGEIGFTFKYPLYYYRSVRAPRPKHKGKLQPIDPDAIPSTAYTFSLT